MKLILQSCFYSAVATATGLAAVLAVGRISWATASGVSGIAIGLTVAAGVALLLRLQLRVVTSVVASGLAAATASFLAISTAELLPPGSTEWILQGGLYGLCIGLPLAVFLGPIGMFENFLDRPSPYRTNPKAKP